MTPEEWAEQELAKFNKEELRKDFENFIVFSKSKIHIDEEGTAKAINPTEEE